MLHRASSARLGLILVLCGSIAAPAMAYKWPGDGPSPGGALAAKKAKDVAARVHKAEASDAR